MHIACERFLFENMVFPNVYNDSKREKTPAEKAGFPTLLTFNTSTAYWMTDKRLRSVFTTKFATFLWTKISPDHGKDIGGDLKGGMSKGPGTC